MFQGKVPTTYHATDGIWNKWVTLITQQAQIGNSSYPEMLELIIDWPEGKNLGGDVC